MDEFSIKFDDTAVLAGLDLIVTGSNDNIRPAAQAAAQVFYDEARALAPKSEKAHFFYGTSYKSTGQRYLFQPGSLKAAIYQVHSKSNSGEGKETYHVAWNHQKVPYGFMVEFGTSNAPAHSFIRRAFLTMNDDALKAGKARYLEGMQKVMGGQQA